MSLEHVFDEMEIRADPFALCALHGRCDLGMARRPSATLHYILAGRGEILVQGRPPIVIDRGTLVLIPALRSHTLRSFGDRRDPVPDCHPAELDLVQHLQTSDGSEQEGKLLALCSHVTVGVRGTQDLIDLIREPIVETVSPGSRIKPAVDQMLQEISAPQAGSRAMIRALLLECMIQLLRNRLKARDRSLNWMVALKDRSVWAALERMLETPGDAHSVESLADAAGMSRSTFAKRFAEAYGSGPMELLRDLRMRLAASLLEDSELPVKRIAELAGFQSRSAFTRTFESVTGTSPSDFRAEIRAGRERIR